MGKRVADLLVEALQAAGVIMLAFAAGLLAAAIGARAAEERARLQPTAEKVCTDSVRAQPAAKQLAPPNQPDVSARDACTVDELYRLLIGPQPGELIGSPARAPGLRAVSSVDADWEHLGAGRARHSGLRSPYCTAGNTRRGGSAHCVFRMGR
jgi:hypothetical protein